MSEFDVTIAGETNLDLILYGLEETMPVERELLASGFRMTLGGSSAILAHNLAALGTRVGFITKTGDDTLGEIALTRVREAGVDLSRSLISKGEQTGVTLLLPHGATRHILTYSGTIATLSVADLDVEYLARGRHFHVSSLFLQTALQAGLPELCENLRKRGMTVSLDTNDDPADQWGEPLASMLEHVDLLLPNDAEAKRMARCDDLSEAVALLAAKVPVVAVKCGRSGALVQRGSERWEIPAEDVTPVDTVGAGDSFNAGFLAGYLGGKSLPTCAAMGNAVAAQSTRFAGGTEAFRTSTARELLEKFRFLE